MATLTPVATPLSALPLAAWLALTGAEHVPSDMYYKTGAFAHVSHDMSEDADAVAPAPGPAEPEPEPEPAPYGVEQAQADIELVLTSRDRDYLEARARLEQRPELAAPQVAARLVAVPAPNAAEQRRLLALLSGIARPEDIGLFADAMRRDVAAAAASQEQGIELAAAEPWREILRAQGPAAAAALTGLVAEKNFTEELRGLLLGDLVSVTAVDRLAELIDLVGLGAPALRAALRQAIVRRARGTPGERALLLRVVDAALDGDQAARLPGLVLLRAALADAGDAASTRRAAGLAEDDGASFAARVAAIRVLVARRGDPTSQAVLERLVARHLPPERRSDQRSEILGAIALTGLDAPRAAALVERLQLTRAEAPRIASAAFGVARLAADGAWLDDSQRHPWPEVRAAALARIEGPCEAAVLGRLRDATAAEAEPDATVAREVIAALGRCGGPTAFAALQAVVVDANQSVDRRAEAARQLVDRHGTAGADVVAAVLRSTDDLAVALRLVRALQRLTTPRPEAAAPAEPSAAVREALCGAVQRPELAVATRRAIRSLFPELEEPCAGR